MSRTFLVPGKSLSLSRNPVARAHPRVTNVSPFDNAIIGNLFNRTIAPFPPLSDLWNPVGTKHAVELALEATLVSEVRMSELSVEGANDDIPLLAQVHAVKPDERFLFL
jgi:hypothetical protein